MSVWTLKTLRRLATRMKRSISGLHDRIDLQHLRSAITDRLRQSSTRFIQVIAGGCGLRSAITQKRMVSGAVTLAYVVTNILPFSAVVAIVGLVERAEAAYVQNDTQGFFAVDFKGNALGFIPRASNTQDTGGEFVTDNITQDASGGRVGPSNSTLQSRVSTIRIEPGSMRDWNRVILKGNLTAAGVDLSKVKVNLFSCTTPTLTPIAGYQNMTVPASLTLDISGLDHVTTPCIHVQVEMDGITSGIAPFVSEIRATWDPLPVYLITMGGDKTKPVGADIGYNVRYSHSFVDDTDVVVWVPVPMSLTDDYGRPVPLTVERVIDVPGATSGVAPAGGVTVGGVSLPAGAVYWHFASVRAGDTYLLRYFLSSENGTQNGVSFTQQAHVDGFLGDLTVSDDNLDVAGNQSFGTVLTSAPKPFLEKNIIDGTMYMNDQHRVTYYSGTAFDQIVTYTIRVENKSDSPTNEETIFDPKITDDLKDIYTKLGSLCSIPPAGLAARIKNISDSGVHDHANAQVIWDMTGDHMTPGEIRTVTFDVDYSGCPYLVPLDTPITNRVKFTADNIAEKNDRISVFLGVDPNPTGIFAKGDKVRNVPEIRADEDDNLVHPITKKALPHQPHDDSYSYLLHVNNVSVTRLRDTVFMDRAPDEVNLIGVTLPASVVGTVYYLDTTTKPGGYTAANSAAGVLPAFDPASPASAVGTDGFTSTWTTTKPAGARWFAVHVPCIPSVYLSPDTSSGAECFDSVNTVPRPGKFSIDMQVQAINPAAANICNQRDFTNYAHFQIHGNYSNPFTGTTHAPYGSPIISQDWEDTHTIAKKGDFAEESEITGDDFIVQPTAGTYTITVTNSGADTLGNVANPVLVSIPRVPIVANGTTAYMTVQSLVASGGTRTTVAGVGEEVRFTNIAPGESRTITLVLKAPAGVTTDTTAEIIANISGISPALPVACNTATYSAKKTITVQALPRLAINKKVFEKLIKPAHSIHYQMTVANTSNTPTRRTVIVDRVPDKTRFTRAYTGKNTIVPAASMTKDDLGNRYQCLGGCKVYFSDDIPPLPAAPSPANTFEWQDIADHFSLGQQVTELSPVHGAGAAIVGTNTGIWQPVDPNMNPLYVAYVIDNATTGVFRSGGTATIGLQVINDENNYAAGIDGSPAGSIINNAAAIFSDELLQSVSSRVRTTILPDPGLDINKYSEVNGVADDYQSVNRELSWIVEYVNSSGSENTGTDVTDVLPPEVELLRVYHTWNANTGTPAKGLNTNKILLYDKTGGGVQAAAGNNLNVTEELPAFGSETVVRFHVANGSPAQVFPNDPNAVAPYGAATYAPTGFRPATGLNTNGDLLSLEGGKIEYVVRAKLGTPNLSTLTNKVEACYYNPENSFCLEDTDPVIVQTPDLYLTKGSDITDPIIGGNVNYTLSVSNQGNVDADNIIIRDILPAGLCFVPGSTSVTTPEWTLTTMAPVITEADPGADGNGTPDCATEPTLLTWNRVIKFNGPTALSDGRTTLAAGILPQNSPTILIGYRATVSAGVARGTTLTNGASIYDDEFKRNNPTPPAIPSACQYFDYADEGDILAGHAWSNCTTQPVIVSMPDPQITKSAPTSVGQGDTFMYTLTYRNPERDAAPNAYIIESLPVENSPAGDNETLSLTADVLVANGETVCYSTAGSLPAFDPSAGAFASCPAPWTLTRPATGVTYIAIKLGTLAGFTAPRTIQIPVKAVKNDGTTVAPIGALFTNTATITTLDRENSSCALLTTPNASMCPDLVPGNNVATTDTRVPGMDLAVTKEGSIEGPFPGLAPGDTIEYVVNYSNQGAQNACEVVITDTLPAELELLSPAHNFSNITLTKDGTEVKPVKTNGTPWNTPIPVTYTYNTGTHTMTWKLGLDDGSAMDYSEVCLPSESTGSFTVFARVKNTILDGTTMTNTINIRTDSAQIDSVSTNNSDTSITKVYRPDLMIRKAGTGVNPTTGATDTNFVGIGEDIEWKVEYNNIGNFAARNSVIEETVPAGTCYTSTSFTPPAGTQITYYDASNNLITPAGSIDCRVHRVIIRFIDEIPAPATYVGEGCSEAVSPMNGYIRNSAKIDINSDGKLDIISFSGAGSDSWRQAKSHMSRINTGTGGLESPIDLPGGSSSVWTSETVDVNGDGRLDLATFGAYFDHSKYYINNGDGTWGEPVTFDTNQGIQGSTSLDIDSDGDTDMFAVGSGGGILYRNNGSGFDLPINLGGWIGTVPQNNIIKADLDGDGDQDIAAVGSNGTTVMHVWRDTGSTLGAATPVTGTAITTGLSLRSGDIDNDGDIDLVAFHTATDFRVYRNNGAAIFTESIVSTGVTASAGSQLSDFNNDGKLDVFITSALSTPRFLAGNGDGTFTAPVTISGSTDLHHTSQMIDINSDGVMDIVGIGERVAAYMYTSSGWQASLVGAGMYTLTSQKVDLNSDSREDIVFFGIYGGPGYVFLNNGDGTMTPGGLAGTTQTTCTFAGSRTTNANNINSSFQRGPMSLRYDYFVDQPSTMVINMPRPGVVHTADIDGDGDKDLIHTSREGVAFNGVYTHRNDGLGNFTMTQLTSDGTANGSLVADHDNDGDVDIFQGSNGFAAPAWWRNNGAGIFTQVAITGATAHNQKGGATIDYDNDGDLDVIFSSLVSTNIQVYEFNSGAFTTMTPIAGSIGMEVSGESIDINNDGRSDVILGAYFAANANQAKIMYYEGNIWKTTLLGTASDQFSVFQTLDIDSDGDEDIFAFGRKNSRSVLYRNNGDGTVTQLQILAPRDHVNIYGSVKKIDWNSDGNMDIVVGQGELAQSVKIYYTHGDGTVTVGDSFFVDGGAAEFFFEDLTRDGLSDIIYMPHETAGGACLGVGINNRSYIPQQSLEDVAPNCFPNSSGEYDDFNGDGVKDLIRSHWNVTTARLMLGRADTQTARYATYIDASPAGTTGFTRWQKLYVTEDIPDGADIRYRITTGTHGSGVCSGTVLANNIRPNPDGSIDLSAYTQARLCLETILTAPNGYSIPALKKWNAIYDSSVIPSFTWRTTVQDSAKTLDPRAITNTATIATDTPEIDEPTFANNRTTDDISLRQSDVRVTKSVDKGVASAGDPLVYTISVKNQGVNPALVHLEDVIGAGHGAITGVSVVSTMPDAGRRNAYSATELAAGCLGPRPAVPASYLNPVCLLRDSTGATPGYTLGAGAPYTLRLSPAQYTNGTTTEVFPYGYLKPGEEHVYTVTTSVLAGTPIGTLLPNTVCAKSDYLSGVTPNLVQTVAGNVGAAPSTPTSPPTTGLSAGYKLLQLRANFAVYYNYTGTVWQEISRRDLTSQGTSIDIDPTNDCANTEVLVGDAANVWLTKDGSTSASLGGTVTYDLDFGNNGNLTANNVYVSDPLPANLTFVSALETSAILKGFVCQYDAGAGANGTIICSHDGVATTGSTLSMMPGDTGTITVTALVSSDLSLVSAPYTASSPYMIENTAEIKTIGTIIDPGLPTETIIPESRTIDNSDEHRVPVVMGALASIAGHVFVDLDQDGYLEGGEKGIENVSVFLRGVSSLDGKIYGPDPVAYGPGNAFGNPDLYTEFMNALTAGGVAVYPGLPAGFDGNNPATFTYVTVAPTLTDSDGAWSFSGLDPGVYDVLESQPSAYSSVHSVGGYLSLVESPVGSGTYVPATDDAVDGQGTVSRSGSGTILPGGIGSSDSNRIQRIVLGIGDDSVNNDFGEIGGSIGNQIYWDLDQNGEYSNALGDMPLVGVAVRLYRDVDQDGVIGASDTLIATTYTSVDGRYLFSGLLLDDGSGDGEYNYLVSVPVDIVNGINNVLGGGVSSTDANSGSGANDDARDPAGYSVILSNATLTDETADYGYYTPNIIGDTVWLDDVDGDGLGDGIYDPDGADNILGTADDEVGVANVNVYLYIDGGVASPGALGAPVAQTRTDANGRYSFANLSVGDYRIRFELPLGYLPTTQDVMIGLGDDSDDSDVVADQRDIWYGYTGLFTVGTNTVDMSLDAGIITTQLSALGNIVWNDSDADGIQDTGEAGVNGAVVTLYDSATFNPVRETLNDLNGNGLYDPSVSEPFTDSNGNGIWDTGEPFIDVDGNGRWTAAETFIDFDADGMWDQGFAETDTNGNGILDVSEDTNGNGVLDTEDTNGNGVLDMDDLDFDGIMDVDESLSWSDNNGNGIPELAEYTDNDGDGVMGTTSEDIDNDGVLDIDESMTWSDTNMDGIPDPGEYTDLDSDGIMGDITTVEDLDGDGILDIDESATWSDNNGNGIPELAEYIDNDGDGMMGTTDEAPADGSFDVEDANGNGILDTEDANANGILDTGTEVDSNGNGILDNGLVQMTTANRDHDLDVGTAFVDGAYLFTGMPAGDYFVQFDLTAMNAANGTNYRFTTQDDAGGIGAGDNTDDSDVGGGLTVADSTEIISLVAGERNLTLDAGIWQPASLGNIVWNDRNGDGIYDLDGADNIFATLDDELPVDGVTVTLHRITDGGDGIWGDPDGVGPLVSDDVWTADPSDADGNTLSPVLTGNGLPSGAYEFLNLIPGRYGITILPLTGYKFSKTFVQMDNGVDNNSDIDPSTESTTVIRLDSGEDDFTWDAGIWLPASLGNFVWHDLNADGLYEALGNDGIAGDPDGVGPLVSDDETPLENISVELWSAGADGALGGGDDVQILVDGEGNAFNGIGTLTTDASGNYRFENLLPGKYYVRFVTGAGQYITNRVGTTDDSVDDTSDAENTWTAGVASANYGRSTVVEIIPGEDEITLDAGIVMPASVSDFVFADVDRDGVYEVNGNDGSAATTIDNDRPLAGVTVTLYRVAPGVNGTYGDADDVLTANPLDITGVATVPQTTGTSGLYSFGNLVPGVYAVRMTEPAVPVPAGFPDYQITTRIGSVYDTPVNNSSNLGTDGISVSVSLSSGETITALDGGWWAPARLGNIVWNDRDADGVYEPLGNDGIVSGDDELPVEGVIVTLLDNTNTPVTVDGLGNTINPVTTPASGLYAFTNLLAGEYKVRFEIPTGVVALEDFVFTRSNMGSDDTVDSDAVSVNAAPPYIAETALITLEMGEIDETIDAGIWLPASLGNFVWHDLNGDGLQDPDGIDNVVGDPDGAGPLVSDDETGIPGVSVTLWSPGANGVIGGGDDVQVLVDGFGNSFGPGGVVLTGLNGEYVFGNLIPGDYYVKFDASAVNPLYRFTFRDMGGDDALDSDALASDGTTIVTTIIPGENDTRWDAGLFVPASLSDFVFVDVNRDGIYDADGGDNNLGTVLDNDVALTGATVTLWSTGPDGVIGGGDDVMNPVNASGVATVPVVTVGDGLYSFVNLLPGTYYVTMTAPGAGSGFASYVSTAQGAGVANDVLVNNSSNLVGNASGAVNSVTVTLTSGENVSALDGGWWAPARLGNIVWNDRDADGVYEPLGNDGIVSGDDEGTLAGVEVRLYAADGVTQITTDAYGNTFGVGGVITTAGNGVYSFGNLIPGTYRVGFTIPNGVGQVLENYVFTNQTGTTDDNVDNTSDANRTTGLSPVITMSVGEINETIDAGIWLPASLGNFVWHDLNGDGLQDPDGIDNVVGDPDGAGPLVSDDETGIPGVSVTLWSPGIDGVIGGGDDVQVLVDGFGNSFGPGGVVLTGLNGEYVFGNLIPGDYYVSFGTTTPSGDAYGFTVRNVGSNDAIDSDADRTSGQSGIVTLISGTQDTSVDAGMILANIAIGNRVWWDVDGDGVQENNGRDGVPGTTDDEIGVDGVTVELFYDDDANTLTPMISLGTKITSGGGLYNFNDIAIPTLSPGMYRLSFTLPSGHHFDGWTVGNTDVGTVSTDTDTDSDVTVDSGNGNRAWTQDFVLVENTDKSDLVDLRYDAGLVRYFSLGDRIWHDLDNDGIQDASDILGVNGVLVEVIVAGVDGIFGTADDTVALDRNGLPLSMTTLANGLYHFDDVLAGTYRVRTTLPMGYFVSPALVGADRSVDNNLTTVVNPLINIWMTDSVVFDISRVGNTDTTYDVGIYDPVDIGDFVWLDSIPNGVQDVSESGVDGVTVELYEDVNNDGVIDTSSPASPDYVRNTVTGDDPTTVSVEQGWYEFSDLVTGSYRVKVIPPAQHAITPFRDVNTGGGNDSNDSDMNPSRTVIANYGVSHTINVTNGMANDISLDAGLVQFANIGNLVWIDVDKDGIQEIGVGGEEGLNGATVRLLDSLGNPVISSITGLPVPSQTTRLMDHDEDPLTPPVNGGYLFTQIEEGDYILEFVLPFGLTKSPENAVADDEQDSDGISVSFGSTNTVVRTGVFHLTAGIDDYSRDLGVFSTYGGGGGEPPLPPVTPPPVPPVVPPTDPVPPVTPPVTPVPPIDPVPVPPTDETPEENVYPTTPVQKLGDTVWYDNNKNGIQDNGENGISDVVVVLRLPGVDGILGNADDEKRTTVTAPDGSYLFTDIPVGKYRVTLDESTINFAGHNEEVLEYTTSERFYPDICVGCTDMLSDFGLWTSEVKIETGFKLPRILPKTGTNDEAHESVSEVHENQTEMVALDGTRPGEVYEELSLWTKIVRKVARVVKNEKITTEQDDWIRASRASVASKIDQTQDGSWVETDIEYWMNTLPYAEDHHAERYVVIPSLGIVTPVRDVPAGSVDHSRMIDGQEIDINQYLRSGVMQYPGTAKTSAGHDDVGNMVIFGHSSYWKHDAGRYKTIFATLPELVAGEEVWVYEKMKDEENEEGQMKNATVYSRSVYRIQKSYETAPDDVGILLPQKELTHGLTLFTCTPIGGIENRWIVTAERIGSDESVIVDQQSIVEDMVSRIDLGDDTLNAQFEALIRTYGTTPENRSMMRSILKKLREKYVDDEVRQNAIKLLLDILKESQ